MYLGSVRSHMIRMINRLFAFIAGGGGPGGKRFFVRPPEHAVVTSVGDKL